VIDRPPPAPIRIDDIRSQRTRVEQRGNSLVLREPGNRTIVKQDNRVIIRADESQRFSRFASSSRPFRKPDGTTETVFVRPDGSRLVTITDSHGRIIRRVRRMPGGREIVFVDDRPFYRRSGGALAVGLGVGLGVGALIALSRPAIAIPRERYIVDYDRASDDDLYEAFTAAPVARLERRYSLDEIRFNPPLREHMRRVDLDSITFDTGSATVSQDQYFKLERLARIINRVIERDPAEVFLIEGHTDAVGDPEDNLSLSDRRAEAIADILSSEFGIPPENLVTQGYGEQELKIETQGPERQNRRVTMRRIGPLLNREANN
jgi:outer membrane protein OmpA-like peptidoglycan-associated protein